MYKRASLGNFCIFTLKKLLFLPIFCLYFRNFVGTNDILVGLHCTDRISKCTDKTPKKHYDDSFNQTVMEKASKTLSTNIRTIETSIHEHYIK